MFHISRRRLIRIALGVALPALAISAAWTQPAQAAGKTITAVMHSDLRIIDPGFTTALHTDEYVVPGDKFDTVALVAVTDVASVLPWNTS